MKKDTLFKFLLPGLLLAATLCMGVLESFAVFNERPLALVTRIIPELAVKNSDRDTTAARGFELFSGDTLRTDEHGFAFVVFMDRSTARVRPESQLVIHGMIERNQNSQTRIDLNSGEIFIDLEKRPDNELEVYSTNTVATVKGTRFGSRDTGYHWVEEGEIEVGLLETDEAVTITGGMYARYNEEEASMETGYLTDEELEELAGAYKILEQELIEKRIRLRFIDENGQIREEEVIYYEQQE